MSREMKHSGVPWIGEIREGWGIDTIGNLYTLRTEKVSDKDYAPLSVTKMGIVPQLETAAKTDDGDNRKLVRVGDFAINSRSDRRGSCGISAYDGSVSLINLVLTPRGQMYPRFYNWLFHTELFADEFYKWGHGIVDDLWTTRWQEMKRISIVSPSYQEQQRIAEFLDRKCAEVDEMIALQEQIIEELKAYKQSVITEAVTKGLNPAAPMRDSGIEWIGSIPEHWEVHRIKNHFSIISGSGFDVNLQGLEDGELPICKASDISRADKVLYAAENYLSREVALSQKFNIIPIGSIIFPKIGEAMKKNRRAICAVECCVDNNCQALVPNGINNIYSYYLLCCIKMEWYDNAGTIPSISNQKLRIEHIPFPTPTEQQVIADYLDEKCDEIDKLIAIKQQKIENLKEYKKSIIYEYVTGKKEVE